ncbi:MAG: divergent polysaccharide deacetylase family protein [Spirochaetota bacterium]
MRTSTLYSLMLILIAVLCIVLSRIIDLSPPRTGERTNTAATNALTAPDDTPRIAIVIDDCGAQRTYEERYLALSPDIVFAVLPEGAYASRFAGTLAQRGYEYIVHMPMEPHDENEVRGMHYLTVSNDAKAVKISLEKAFTAVRGARGMNNHTGSRFTEEKTSLVAVADFCRERGVYFLDSRTSIKSAAYDVMRDMHIPAAKRDIFLDDTRTVRAIRERFNALIARAKRQGSAIAIGHYTSEMTLAVLAEELPRLTEHGVRLVRLSELVQ